MRYSDLVRNTAVRVGVTQNEAKAVLDAALQVIKESVKRGDEVLLNGVGKFSSRVKPARTGINPATKEKVEIPETVVVTFRASKNFRELLNIISDYAGSKKDKEEAFF